MLSTKHALLHLSGQGGNPVHLTIAADALATSGLIPKNDRDPLNGKQLVALLIGACAPNSAGAAEFVAEYGNLESETGVTFGGFLEDAFRKAPCDLNLRCIRVCQNFKNVIVSPLGEDEDVL